MLRFPPYSWVGFVMGDTTTEMIVCCSEVCVQALLEE
jgi:hypothetical protein